MAAEIAAEEVRAQVTQAAARAAQEVAGEVYQGADEAMQQGLQEAAAAAAAAAVEAQVLEKTVEEAKRQYSYAGRESKTANRTQLEEAVDMYTDGVDNETIRKATGWYRGMEGKWRYEIDDSVAEIRDVATTRMHTLPELLEHPTLYEAYPELRETQVTFADLGGVAKGQVLGRNIQLDSSLYTDGGRIGSNREELMRTLLHEVQHQVQEIEGFSEGSSWRYWQRRIDQGFVANKNDAGIRKAEQARREFFEGQPREMQELIRQHNRLKLELREQERKVIDAETVAEGEAARARMLELREQIADLTDRAAAIDPDNDPLWTYEMMTESIRRAEAGNRPMTSEELYRKTAGEIEARDVSNRREMDAEQRRSNKPDLPDDAVFVENWLGRQYSERKGYLLTPAEYKRLRSAWMDYKYKGYEYTRRENGGILVDFDDVLVYTDAKGEPEYVLEVTDQDRWANNDIIQTAMELEERGTDHETQRIVLESMRGAGSAHFRTREERKGNAGEKLGRAREAARAVRRGDRAEVSEEGEEINYSERRHRTPTIRQAVSRMKVDERMNETEKLLLGRYKADVAEYERLQGEIDQLVEAMQGEQTPEQATANKNRMGVSRELSPTPRKSHEFCPQMALTYPPFEGII